MDRVKRSGRMYAYFMESAMIKYITHKECNLTQIGGLLDAKEYGIGMPVSEFKLQQKSVFMGTGIDLHSFFWEFSLFDFEIG